MPDGFLRICRAFFAWKLAFFHGIWYTVAEREGGGIMRFTYTLYEPSMAPELDGFEAAINTTYLEQAIQANAAE